MLAIDIGQMKMAPHSYGPEEIGAVAYGLRQLSLSVHFSTVHIRQLTSAPNRFKFNFHGLGLECHYDGKTRSVSADC
jgi:hypothetical protein